MRKGREYYAFCRELTRLGLEEYIAQIVDENEHSYNDEWPCYKIDLNLASGSDQSGDDITYSNWLYLKETYGDIRGFRAHQGRDTCYSVTIAKGSLKGQELGLINDLKRLANYPIISESTLERLHQDWEYQAWKDYIAFGFSSLLNRYLDDLELDEIDARHNLNQEQFEQVVDILTALEDHDKERESLYYEALGNEDCTDYYYEPGIANLVVKVANPYDNIEDLMLNLALESAIEQVKARTRDCYTMMLPLSA